MGRAQYAAVITIVVALREEERGGLGGPETLSSRRRDLGRRRHPVSLVHPVSGSGGEERKEKGKGGPRRDVGDKDMSCSGPIWVTSCTPGVMTQLGRSPHPELVPQAVAQAPRPSRHTPGWPMEPGSRSSFCSMAQASPDLMAPQPPLRTPAS